MTRNDKHTPGPWRVGEVEPARFPAYPIKNGAGITIAEVPISARGDSDKHARRIVACVNACEGIPEQDLEFLKGRIASGSDWHEVQGEIHNNARDITKLRNENALLKSVLGKLIESLKWEEDRSGTTYNGYDEARAALGAKS